MAIGAGAETVAAIPWTDRPGAEHRKGGSPRSERDTAILRTLVRRIPANDAAANNNLGAVFYQKGLFGEAAQQFERALELDPRMAVAERNLQIVYFATDHFDTTLHTLQLRLEADPDDTDTRLRLARMFLFGGDASASLRELKRLAIQRPDDTTPLRWMARARVRLGELDEALETLFEAADRTPGDARVAAQIGELFYLRGAPDEARNWLERAIGLDDTMAGTHHLLAFVYGELGDDERAVLHAARAAELVPSYAKAEKSLSLDGYSEARYAELIGERPQRPAVAHGGGLIHYNLGLALRQKGLYDDALREFRAAAERGEDRYLVRQAQAEVLLLRESGEPAIGLYRELIEEEPASPKLWNELGVAHHQLGDLAEAARSYEHALSLDPMYALAWNNLGVARHHRGYPGSDDALGTALDAGRSLAEIWRNLGWLHHVRRAWPEAELAYRKALDADTRLASAWTGLGMLLLERGETDQASMALARAIECDPDLPEAHYHYAFALSAAGDYPGALRETSRALELSPYITFPRFQLLIDLQFEDAGVPAPELDAGARIRGGETIDDFELDVEDIDEALAAVDADLPKPAGTETEPVSPSRPASIEWLAAARSALGAGQYAEAMSDVQRAAALGANRIETRLLQGEIHLAAGAAGEAVERFDGVLSDLDRVTDPLDAGVDANDVRCRALAGLARSRLELRRAAGAVEAAERWLALAPGDTAAIAVLADALEEKGEPRRAARVLEAALAQSPDEPELVTRLGSAYLASGDLERAERTLRGAIAKNGNLPAARAALGRLLVVMGRVTEAEREYRIALDAIPSFTAAAVGLADLLVEQGRAGDAIDVLISFLDVDAYNLAGLTRLGDILWESGRQKEAGVAYRRVLRFDPGHERALTGLERLEPAIAAGGAAGSWAVTSE
jgi:tetratricopeptide (TPR) repeat protein